MDDRCGDPCPADGLTVERRRRIGDDDWVES